MFLPDECASLWTRETIRSACPSAEMSGTALALGRSADDQNRFKDATPRPERFFGFNHAEHKVRRASSDLWAMLIDAGKRNAKVSIVMEVSAANNGNVQFPS